MGFDPYSRAHGRTPGSYSELAFPAIQLLSAFLYDDTTKNPPSGKRIPPKPAFCSSRRIRVSVWKVIIRERCNG